MIPIRGYINSENVIPALKNCSYSDADFNNLKSLIMKMDDYNDSVHADLDTIAEIYSLPPSISNEILRQYIYRNVLKVTESSFGDIKNRIDGNLSDLKECLLCINLPKENIKYLLTISDWTNFNREALKKTDQSNFHNYLKRCFENCIFGEAVVQSIKRVGRIQFNENLDKYVNHLSALNDKAIDIWKDKDTINDEVFCRVFKSTTGIDNSTESDRSSADKLKYPFKFVKILNGKTLERIEIYECEKHTKLERYGKNAQRIYFVIKDLENEWKVLIGFIGNHQ